MAEMIMEALLACVASIIAGIALYFIQKMLDSHRNDHRR